MQHKGDKANRGMNRGLTCIQQARYLIWPNIYVYIKESTIRVYSLGITYLLLLASQYIERSEIKKDGFCFLQCY